MKTYNTHPGGSRWSKWDLHVHTPHSVVQEYGGDSEAIWTKYIEDLEALPSDLKVLGINDYIFVDGYEKLLSRINEDDQPRLTNIDLLLPVLEFRLETLAGSKDLNKINFHVIFSNEVSPESIRRHFLDKLAVKANGYNKGVRNKKDLEDFGRFCKQNLPPDKRDDQSDLFFGFNALSYNESNIRETLKNCSEFSKDGIPLYLTAIGRTEWDDMRWDSAPAQKRDLINSADFVFCASRDIAQHRKNRQKLEREHVNTKLFHFSDAHHFSDDASRTSMRIGDSFTWIKGNPTFEGLRQTIFEFDERVRVSLGEPFPRNPGTIIDSIVFHSPANRFTARKVVLNPYLNVIIGGFSMGKSLLLHQLGKSIDPNELIRVARTSKRKDKNDQHYLAKYDFIKKELDPNYSCSVHWQDGKVDQLGGEAGSTGRKIMYFPQGYIGTLANPSLFKSKNKLDSFIIEIARQNPEVNIEYEKFIDIVREYEVRMVSQIDEFYRTAKELKDAGNKLRDIGEKENIEKYILQLEGEVAELKSQSGLSETEQNLYNDAVGKINKLESTKIGIDLDRRNIEQFFLEIENLVAKVSQRYDQSLQELSEENVKVVFREKLEFLSGLADRVVNGKDSFFVPDVGLFSIWKNENAKALDEQQALREPLAAKLPDHQAIKLIEAKVQEERKKIKQFAQQAKVRDSLREGLVKQKLDLMKLYDKTYRAYSEICEILNHGHLKNDAGVELFAETGFYYEHLKNHLAHAINQRTIKPTRRGGYRLKDLIERDEFNNFEEHRNLINSFFEEAVDGHIPLRSGWGINGLLKELLIDKFYLNWRIIYGGDQLKHMSPGKANLVILKLLIEMSDDEWPILLDQPEDQLDNSSINSDLVVFLKKKKNHRQIIIVTHNPNLLVGADAENIVVANRNGEGRENYSFEYVSGGIEHSEGLDEEVNGLDRQGVREHICEILEGGKDAFRKREGRYGLSR